MRGGCLHKVANIVIWLRKFWYFGKLVTEEKWSLPRGVCKWRFDWIRNCLARCRICIKQTLVGIPRVQVSLYLYFNTLNLYWRWNYRHMKHYFQNMKSPISSYLLLNTKNFLWKDKLYFSETSWEWVTNHMYGLLNKHDVKLFFVCVPEWRCY